MLALGGAAALVTAAVVLPNAMASTTDTGPRTMSADAAQDLVNDLTSQFGSAIAGAYYDAQAGQIIVNVVKGDDNNVIVQVRKAGAVARAVENSTAELTTAARTLKAQATIPGTAWAVDPKTNEILVTADSTVAADDMATLEATVKSLGDGVARIRKTAGEFKPFVAGGDAIFSSGARCSLGFNVTASDGSPAFLTAGHCGVAFKEWSDTEDGDPIATVDQATFPGDGDFALVKYDDPDTDAPSEVGVGDGGSVPIVQADDATVGLQVFRMGSTTGLHDGTVTGLDATVNYEEGSVTGLIQTDVCAEPGDSGGPLFTEDGSAIGLTSGGSGDCTAGGETFFQPVTTALTATGAAIS
ncbi:S1 family peptidase [Streptomyces sp. NBC_01537]|uniref:S1 family peptidase n=1 Tax=Streptomyces sp. NBC_01537 TaxID=2903896 RepID=UPI0038647F42